MVALVLETELDTRYIGLMLGHQEFSITTLSTLSSMRELKQVHTATYPARM